MNFRLKKNVFVGAKEKIRVVKAATMLNQTRKLKCKD